MLRRYPLIFTLAGLGAFLAPAHADPLAIPVKEYKLDNGLRLVVSEDHSVPTVAVDVYYDVGARDEPEGHTGFAHLFEHMMFEGSANVGKTMHFHYVMANGGTMNGNTTGDRTTYFEEMPSNDLDLALWLEADRMRALDVTQDKLDNQRETVKEERRQSYENRAYGEAFIRLAALAYTNFAFQHSTIGSMDDLNAAPLAYVKWFYQTYYSPNDAVITVCGDVNPDDVEKRVEYYFGTILTRAIPPRLDFTEPAQGGLRTDTIQDGLAKVPMTWMAFHTPAWRQPDDYPLQLLGDILAGGDSSRLQKLLVDDKQIATSVNAGPDNRRGPNLFEIQATLKLGHTGAELRPLILAELAKIKTDGVTADELQKAKNQVRIGFVGGLRSHLGRALQLGLYELYFGDASLLASEPDQFDKVTADDIKRVANTYFTDDNRTDLDDVPAAPTAAPTAAGGK